MYDCIQQFKKTWYFFNDKNYLTKDNKTKFKDINDVPVFPIKYSKYAGSLDKLFKAYSLEHLKKSLNSPKKYKFNEFESFKKKDDNL